MKLRDAIVAIQVCAFLFGVAWLDRAFEGYHVPPLVAEVHKPDADAQILDDGEQDVANLVVPQLPYMPRLVAGGFNQFVEQPPAWFRAPSHTLVTILTPYPQSA
jgi:hypothetical protein